MAGKGKSDGAAPRMNHVRAFVLEATMTDEGLAQLTQALSGFVRPATPAGRIAGPITAAIAAGPAQTAAPEIEEAEAVDEEEYQGEPVEATAGPRAPARVRKYTSPNVIDLDLNAGDVPWSDFAAEKKPDTVPNKYLVAAAWLKLYRGLDAISMHHVYTCFRHPKVKWPTGNEDFDAPLRYLKKRKTMDRAPGRGQYAINHLGLNEVELMGGAAADE